MTPGRKGTLFFLHIQLDNHQKDLNPWLSTYYYGKFMAKLEKYSLTSKYSLFRRMIQVWYQYFKICLATILATIFWHFLIISLRSDSPQVKRYLISSITNWVHELPHELPNDLRLRILGNQEILEKVKFGWRCSLVPSLPFRN